jgi:hypothetical protein
MGKAKRLRKEKMARKKEKAMQGFVQEQAICITAKRYNISPDLLRAVLATMEIVGK